MRANEAGGIYHHDSISASEGQISPLHEHGAETKRAEGTWLEKRAEMLAAEQVRGSSRAQRCWQQLFQ